MKDLYRRIGVGGITDDTAALSAAIKSAATTDPAAAEAARLILLNPHRKTAYDRSHRAAACVGQVRVAMRLTETALAVEADCGDFELNDSMPAHGSALGRFVRGGWNGKKSVENVWVLLWGAAMLLVAVLVLAAVTSPGKSRSAPPAQATQPERSITSVLPPQTAPAPPRDPDASLRSLVESRLRRAGMPATPEAVAASTFRLRTASAEPRPFTGVLSTSFTKQAVAPLEVRTSAGEDYYIKLVPVPGVDPVLTAYIRGGELFEVDVPLGTYELRYAAGTAWYGPALDFGLGAVYSKAESLFTFRQTADGYSGFTVELILQRGGNLRTTEVDPTQF